MRATKMELEKFAAKLSATARTLPPGEDRQNAYREIARFRDRIAALGALTGASHSAAPVLPSRSSRINPQRQHQA